MIALCTDFGINGPYLAQVEAVLYRFAPEQKVLTLFADAPVFQPMLAAYLLPAYCLHFPPATVFLCVVDPGVGSARHGIVVQADDTWWVGPDNGLFNSIVQRATHTQVWRIPEAPAHVSATFHGRDVFAPVAAKIATGVAPETWLVPYVLQPPADWPQDLARVVYIDHYGNVMTGVRAKTLSRAQTVSIAGVRLPRVRTFSDVPVGCGFCYANANGLLEIAVNQGAAAQYYQLNLGDVIHGL